MGKKKPKQLIELNQAGKCAGDRGIQVSEFQGGWEMPGIPLPAAAISQTQPAPVWHPAINQPGQVKKKHGK